MCSVVHSESPHQRARLKSRSMWRSETCCAKFVRSCPRSCVLMLHSRFRSHSVNLHWSLSPPLYLAGLTVTEGVSCSAFNWPCLGSALRTLSSDPQVTLKPCKEQASLYRLHSGELSAAGGLSDGQHSRIPGIRQDNEHIKGGVSYLCFLE